MREELAPPLSYFTIIPMEKRAFNSNSRNRSHLKKNEYEKNTVRESEWKKNKNKNKSMYTERRERETKIKKFLCPHRRNILHTGEREYGENSSIKAT